MTEPAQRTERTETIERSETVEPATVDVGETNADAQTEDEEGR
jgi:hypothetical protein